MKQSQCRHLPSQYNQPTIASPERPLIQMHNDLLPDITDTVPRINGLEEIAGKYQLILCDVWGVLHNGLKAWPGTIEALSEFRRSGGTVVMVTNAPRPRGPVYSQLSYLGVPDGVFDAVVTSGDVTRELIRQSPRKIFFIGTDKDHELFEGLNIELVDEEAAEAIVCSGPWNEATEMPEDYIELLTRLKARDLPFICANPDIVVEVGDRRIYCAGAIAREYSKLGGKTLIAGKPFAPIYRAAIAEAEKLAGKKFNKSDILAIGDGMPTDIKGAEDFGLDVLFVSSGIHAGEYGPAQAPDDKRLQAFLKANKASPAAYIPKLKW